MRKTTKMVAVLAAMSVMVLGAATMVSAAEKSGWVKEGSDWYFYVKDEAVKNQWALSGNDWYFLNEDGKMATEVFVDNSIPEVVDEDFDFAEEVIDAENDDYFYVDADGVMVTGWKEIEIKGLVGPTETDGKAWYYFGSNGAMYGNTWVLSGDKWYFIKENGRMAERETTDWDGNTYFLAADGVMVTGWYKTEDKTGDKKAFGAKDLWIYADKNGVLVEDGWEKIGSSWYYFGEVSKGAAAATIGDEDGHEYVMQKDTFIEVAKTRESGTELFYLTKSGAMETGLFKVVDDNRYSFYYFAKSNGSLQKNVQTASGKYYFFEADYVRLADDDIKYAVKLADDTYGLLDEAIDKDINAKAEIGKVYGTSTVKEVYKLGTATKWTK